MFQIPDALLFSSILKIVMLIICSDDVGNKNSSDVMSRSSASPRGCLKADFYCLGLGLDLGLWWLGLCLDSDVLALASVLGVGVLVLLRDRDQDINL